MEANEMAVTGFGEIAEKLRRSTVVVHARGRGSGSGVIWSSDGTIVTNAHVVRSAQVSLQLWDGREFDATVATCDPRRDLAVLRRVMPPVDRTHEFHVIYIAVRGRPFFARFFAEWCI